MNSLTYPPKIAVLLSTFNGEKYLSEMMQSICSQEKVELTLFVRDDGSNDATLAILEIFTNHISIHIESGRNIGSTKSFIALLERALNDPGEFHFFAFADQDDIWTTKKLASKYALIAKEITPSLAFCGQEYFQDKTGIYPEGNVFNSRTKIPFFQNPVRGCSMLLNRSLATRITKLNVDDLIHHDFAAYICARLYGNIFYTGSIGMKYRIHPGNQLGLGSFKEKTRNIFRELQKISQAKSVIELFGPGNLRDEDVEFLSSLTSHKATLISKVKFLIRNRFLREDWLGNIWWRLIIIFK